MKTATASSFREFVSQAWIVGVWGDCQGRIIILLLLILIFLGGRGRYFSLGNRLVSLPLANSVLVWGTRDSPWSPGAILLLLTHRIDWGPLRVVPAPNLHWLHLDAPRHRSRILITLE